MARSLRSRRCDQAVVRATAARRLPGAGKLSIRRRRGAVPEIPGHPAAVNAGTVTVLKGRHTCCATPLGWLELVKQCSRGHHHRRPLGFRDDETPRLPLVREWIHASPRRRQAPSVLPLGLPQGLRCSGAPMGGRSNRHRSVDGAGTQERPYTNARVGAGHCFARDGRRGGPAASCACGAGRGEWQRASEGFRRAVGPDHHGAPTRLRSSPVFITCTSRYLI